MPAFQPEPLPSNVLAFEPKRVSRDEKQVNGLHAEALRVLPDQHIANGDLPHVSERSTPTEAPEHLTVPEPERVQIVALAKAGISRRKIGEQVYGSAGGQAYSKVKQTLDAAGL